MSTELATPNVDVKTLATMAADAETRGKVVCKDSLKGDSPMLAQRDAAKAYAAMLKSPLVISTYGAEALSGLNNLVKTMFKDINAGEDPEVAKMIKGLGKRLDDIQHKYNAADPKFVAKYENMRGGFLGILGGAGAFWRSFLRDVKSIQSQIEDAEDVIANGLESTQLTIGNYETLYKENGAELNKVIYQIAVMEYIVDLATADIENSPKGEDFDSTEERGARADLVKNLSNRISAYKSRLFMGQTTSPQLRAQISLNIGLYSTIALTRDITFPMMLMVMIQMSELRKSQDKANQMEAFRNATNLAIQQFAVNASILVPEIEKAVSTPVLMARTVEVMRDAYIKQTEGVIAVLAEVAEQNAVLDDLYQSTQTVFNSQSDKVSDAIIDRAIAATHKLEISTKSLK